jgi:hypothetical protein
MFKWHDRASCGPMASVQVNTIHMLWTIALAVPLNCEVT